MCAKYQYINNGYYSLLGFFCQEGFCPRVSGAFVLDLQPTSYLELKGLRDKTGNYVIYP